MEGLIRETDGPKRFVRIGDQSHSDTLKPYNLRALKQKIIEDAKLGAYTDSKFLFYHYQQKGIEKEMRKCLQDIQKLRNKIPYPDLSKDLSAAETQYENAIKKLATNTAQANAAVCRAADVVFITIAGAAMHREMLEILQCPIGILNKHTFL